MSLAFQPASHFPPEIASQIEKQLATLEHHVSKVLASVRGAKTHLDVARVKAKNTDNSKFGCAMIFCLFAGEWELARKIGYFWLPTSYMDLVGREACDRRHEGYLHAAARRGEEQRERDSNGDRRLGIPNEHTYRWLVHDLSTVSEEVLTTLFDDPETRVNAWSPASGRIGEAHRAYQRAYMLMTLRQHERAAEAINFLMKMAKLKPEVIHGDPDMDTFAKEFSSMALFLHHWRLMRLASDPKERLTEGSRAVLHQLRAVTANFRNKNSDLFGCDDAGHAIRLLIELDCDRQWSIECCRSALHYLESIYSHEVFQFAQQYDAWLTDPAIMGYPSPEELQVLERQARMATAG